MLQHHDIKAVFIVNKKEVTQWSKYNWEVNVLQHKRPNVSKTLSYKYKTKSFYFYFCSWAEIPIEYLLFVFKDIF